MAQQDITTYYPPDFKEVKEKYKILKGDSSLIDGAYTKYFREGTIAMKGTFKDGKPDGLLQSITNLDKYFLKPHIKRKKTGPFEVLSKDGLPIQKGTYFEGELEGLIQSFYPDGRIKKKLSLFLENRTVRPLLIFLTEKSNRFSTTNKANNTAPQQPIMKMAIFLPLSIIKMESLKASTLPITQMVKRVGLHLSKRIQKWELHTPSPVRRAN